MADPNVTDPNVLRPADVSGVVVDSAPAPDGSTHPVTVASQQAGRTDLVLEGGGVKGLGLVGAVLELAEAGYEFRRVAGASAGAIVAVLIAALQARNRPIADLQNILDTIKYTEFESGDSPFARAASGLRLLEHEGLYTGGYLRTWLGAQLKDIGVSTFGDLAITDDRLPPRCRYSLVLMVSDITRGKSVRLPWQYSEYGLAADGQLLVDAVRASMSIPFFFTPERIDARPAVVDGQQVPAQTCTWVDGGLLDNFPVDVFAIDADNPVPGRWPTIGVKLSARGPRPPLRSDGVVSEAKAILETLVDNADRYYVSPADAQRTIFVDHGTVSTTDFHLSRQDQDMLLANGRAAARAFLAARPPQPAAGP
jgi:NTE family protein